MIGDLSKTLHLIHEDNRWLNFRTYLTNKIEDFGFTLIGGLIVSLVCPVMFIVSNVLLGIGLNFTSLIQGEIASTLKHIILELNYQTVIISDTSRLEKNGTSGFTWWKVPKLSLSFLVYLLPSVALLSVLSFGRLNMTLCHPMKAPFLLDNTFVLANNLNFEELYRQRQTYGGGKDDYYFESRGFMFWIGYYNSIGVDGKLMWNAGEHSQGIHFQKYWNLSDINSMIEQYNYVGYHDVCNYPEIKPDLGTEELHIVDGIDGGMMKGFNYFYPGYNERNSSGPNYKKTNIISNITKK